MLFLILSFIIIPTQSVSAGIEIMDQSQGLYDYGFWFDNSAIRWQEFIPTLSNFTSLRIHLTKNGSPGNVIVEIRELNGTVLGHQEIVEATVPSNDWLYVAFQQFSVTPGTKYRIYVYSNLESQSPSDRYFWIGSHSSVYCPKCDNDVTTYWPDYDFAFRTYGVGIKYATVADFDGNRSTDISVYRPSNGKWYIQGESPVSWGLPGDIPVPGQYYCGMTNIAVYRPSNGKWYVYGQTPVWWGMPNDVPVQGDYDGDGVTDFAVYRPSNGKWYVEGEATVWWGLPGDIPIPGDYDGDFNDDIAVYRPSNGKWYIKGETPIWWGMTGDIPVPGDYDGDGRMDIAVYRPSNGKWYVYGQSPIKWGISGDIPIPGDYDGCGDTEIAVLRPSNGKWYIQGGATVWHYLPGDYPLPVRDTNADGDPYQ
jgi:hypothetical protein